ncbi:MAG: cation transporter [Bacteroidetes bacterium]|nr:MAG: cation transporter [Bacteroidota bacterium]
MKERVTGKFLPASPVELPGEIQEQEKKAHRLEVITVIYLFTVIILMYLTLSSSQAMKAAWLEDLLSILPSVTFLVASRIHNKKPTFMFPGGFHRVFRIGFAIGAIALLAMGIYIVIDSVLALVKAEHPTIPHQQVFGYQVWFGWIMILALLYSFVPAMILGIKKMPLSKILHNKLLNVDADTQKADWLTALAAITGIILVGFGLWWADAAAAILISVLILRDGVNMISNAIGDLMGKIPTTVEGEIDPVNMTVIDFFMKQEWVKDVRIRLREEGQVFSGEVFVIPYREENIMTNIENAVAQVKKLDWKIHEITVQPVKAFHSHQAETETSRS